MDRPAIPSANATARGSRGRCQWDVPRNRPGQTGRERFIAATILPDYANGNNNALADLSWRHVSMTLSLTKEGNRFGMSGMR